MVDGLNALQAKRRSVLLMVICAVLWSIAGIFIKIIPWNPLVIAGSRSLISAGIVLVYMRWTGVRFQVNRLSILSGIMLALTFLAFVTANKMTTAANAIVLQYTAPVFIVLISYLLYRQRFERADCVVVGITIAGIALCFFDQLSAGSLAGNFVAILAGLFMAGMFVFTGHADDDSRMSGILLGHLFTAAVGLPVAFFTQTPVSGRIVINIIILGVVQLGIPYILYGVAVKHCSPLVCCLIGAVEPLLNPIWVFLFDGEAPGAFALVGGGIVIGTITIWSVWSDRKGVRDAAQEGA